ncbi:egl-4, partial [Symbiodinium sp. CCMP2456]
MVLLRHGLLGRGGFGAVELVEDTRTGNTFALKALSKGDVVANRMQSRVINEKNLQLMCDSPFIVKLHKTYTSPQHVYFLLELALGGQLYATYNYCDLWRDEACGKFYVAGAALALEHLHGKQIIFRDLKPENLVLTAEGRAKLVDFGCAKRLLAGKAYSTFGTPDYCAPELVDGSGHTHAVDWWALGILAFELMSGQAPFASDTVLETYAKVMSGID